MAIISSALARTAFALTEGTLFQPPTDDTTTIITNIVVVNTAASSANFTILLDDTELFSNTVIPGNSTVSIDLRQVLDAQPAPRKKITGFATATTVQVHISGVEII
jgi:hypothetical protein